MKVTDLQPVDRTSLADIRSQIASLLHPDADPDDVRELVQRWTLAKQYIRDGEPMFDECFSEWLLAHGNSLEMGDVRFYVGEKRNEKIRDLRAAFESALTKLGGDVDLIVNLLGSYALKPGACEQALGKEWRTEHFQQEVVQDIKTGKPQREVKRIDTKYTKPRPGR